MELKENMVNAQKDLAKMSFMATFKKQKHGMLLCDSLRTALMSVTLEYNSAHPDLSCRVAR